MTKSHKKKTLTDWDWTTLVAAWRYYEYRMTIVSAMFPGEIVQRFFGGAYDEDSCRRIAHQFAYTDHHDGESDWSDAKSLITCDKTPWCKFYAFCKAYCDGFTTVMLDGENNGQHIHDEPQCFWCEYTERWYPAKNYIANPERECYCGKEFIKEVK